MARGQGRYRVPGRVRSTFDSSIMSAMDSHGGNPTRLPWPFVRLAALIAVVLVLGIAGLDTGIRAAGGMLMVFAAAALVRRFGANPARGCEVSGQLPPGPARLVAAVQAVVGLIMLLYPATILRLLGVDGP